MGDLYTYSCTCMNNIYIHSYIRMRRYHVYICYNMGDLCTYTYTYKSSVMAVLGCNGSRCVIKIILSLSLYMKNIYIHSYIRMCRYCVYICYSMGDLHTYTYAYMIYMAYINIHTYSSTRQPPQTKCAHGFNLESHHDGIKISLVS
jgi:hypothetical protein